jgi:hypothetical protein
MKIISPLFVPFVILLLFPIVIAAEPQDTVMEGNDEHPLEPYSSELAGTTAPPINSKDQEMAETSSYSK